MNENRVRACTKEVPVPEVDPNCRIVAGHRSRWLGADSALKKTRRLREHVPDSWHELWVLHIHYNLPRAQRCKLLQSIPAGSKLTLIRRPREPNSVHAVLGFCICCGDSCGVGCQAGEASVPIVRPLCLPSAVQPCNIQ
jgi:hypothetical protein